MVSGLVANGKWYWFAQSQTPQSICMVFVAKVLVLIQFIVDTAITGFAKDAQRSLAVLLQ